MLVVVLLTKGRSSVFAGNCAWFNYFEEANKYQSVNVKDEDVGCGQQSWKKFLPEVCAYSRRLKEMAGTSKT